MKSIGFISMLMTFLVLSCSQNNHQTKEDKEKASYEQMKQELLEKEERNPNLFLSISGNEKKNMIGQTVVKGKISSTAKMAVFKDVNIRLDFYSKTKALLESDNETIYTEIKPGHSQNFKTKYFAPKGTDSVALSILSAKIVGK